MQIDLAKNERTSEFSTKRVIPQRKSQMVHENSHEDLILAIANDKCRSSFAQLFKAFAPKIKAFLMSQGLNGQMAEELAQDTLLSVWRKAHLFDEKKAKASTWIYTIARNLRIDFARKEARKKQLPENLWHDFEIKTADEKLIDDENTAKIQAALANLNNEQKEVLRLSFFENLSHSQVADALGLPLGTVKSRIRIGILKIKEMIARNEDINE